MGSFLPECDTILPIDFFKICPDFDRKDLQGLPDLSKEVRDRGAGQLIRLLPICCLVVGFLIKKAMKSTTPQQGRLRQFAS